MVARKQVIVAAAFLVAGAWAAFAVPAGHSPGLRKLIEMADAIVVLRIDRHRTDFGSPSGYSTQDCYIYQTLEGDVPRNAVIPLQLMNTDASLVTPYAHGSTHLMFLTKRANKDEPTEYRTLPFKGAHIALSPLGQEQAPEGDSVEAQVRSLLRGALAHEASEHEQKEKFLKSLLGDHAGVK
ncbi:MAG: hypothetical protein AB7O52_20065 [Planctomycetota bacterium]